MHWEKHFWLTIFCVAFVCGCGVASTTPEEWCANVDGEFGETEGTTYCVLVQAIERDGVTGGGSYACGAPLAISTQRQGYTVCSDGPIDAEDLGQFDERFGSDRGTEELPTQCGWEPGSIEVSDPIGTQRNGIEIPAELRIELNSVVGGNLQVRVCKFVDGLESGFLGDPINVELIASGDTQEVTWYNDELSTTSTEHCTGWQMLGEPVLAAAPDVSWSLRAQIVSPARVANGWGSSCDSAQAAGGSCWSFTTFSSLIKRCF